VPGTQEDLVQFLVAEDGAMPPVRTPSACAHLASVHMEVNAWKVLAASSKHLALAQSLAVLRNAVTLSAPMGIVTVLREHALTRGFAMTSAPRTLVELAASMSAIHTEILSAVVGTVATNVCVQKATVQLMVCACQGRLRPQSQR